METGCKDLVCSVCFSAVVHIWKKSDSNAYVGCSTSLAFENRIYEEVIIAILDVAHKYSPGCM